MYRSAELLLETLLKTSVGKTNKIPHKPKNQTKAKSAERDLLWEHTPGPLSCSLGSQLLPGRMPSVPGGPLGMCWGQTFQFRKRTYGKEVTLQPTQL